MLRCDSQAEKTPPPCDTRLTMSLLNQARSWLNGQGQGVLLVKHLKDGWLVLGVPSGTSMIATPPDSPKASDPRSGLISPCCARFSRRPVPTRAFSKPMARTCRIAITPASYPARTPRRAAGSHSRSPAKPLESLSQAGWNSWLGDPPEATRLRLHVVCVGSCADGNTRPAGAKGGVAV